MKKRIALVYGGNSSEWEISVQSGRNVADNIDRERFDVYEILLKGASWRVVAARSAECAECAKGAGGGESAESAERDERDDRAEFAERIELPDGGIEVDKSDFSFIYNGKKIKFDLAFIMIHGNPGENGLLQGYFEMLGVPFNTCSAFVSNITFDKHSCKRFLDFAGIKMAKDVFVREGQEYSSTAIVKELGLPLFVKPTNGGSSFGISKVSKEEDLDAAIAAAFKENDSVIIEECITGREVTNGIYLKEGKMVRLPVTEIVTEREFFDYEAKYMGLSNEICPAPMSEELTGMIQDMTERIYRYMGCKGLVRIDYIIKGYDIYFLEINSVPGMTPMSLVPAQVRAAGIEMREFFNTLIDEIGR